MTTTLLDIFATTEELESDSQPESMSSPVRTGIRAEAGEHRSMITHQAAEYILLALSEGNLEAHEFWKTLIPSCPDILLNIHKLSGYIHTLFDMFDDLVSRSADVAPHAKEQCRPTFSEMRDYLSTMLNCISSATTEMCAMLQRSAAAFDQKREIQCFTIHRYNVLEAQRRLRLCIPQFRLFSLFRGKTQLVEHLRPPRTWLHTLRLAPIRLSSWTSFEDQLPLLLDRMAGSLNNIDQTFEKIVDVILAIEDFTVESEKSGMERVVNRIRDCQGATFLHKLLLEFWEQLASYQNRLLPTAYPYRYNRLWLENSANC